MRLVSLNRSKYTLYVYRNTILIGPFLYVLDGAAATAAKACELEVFLSSKNPKKQKDVSTMSKKTSGCRPKTIKNSKKRPKIVKIVVKAINFDEKHPFLVIFPLSGLSKSLLGSLEGYFGFTGTH
jgi:hypothetical protein